jgi:hypothetical protein
MEGADGVVIEKMRSGLVGSPLRSRLSNASYGESYISSIDSSMCEKNRIRYIKRPINHSLTLSKRVLQKHKTKNEVQSRLTPGLGIEIELLIL